MNERLKILRKELKLSQTEFGSRIGLTTSAISDIEREKVKNITEGNIKLICREFNVNEEWLRHGTGEIFIKFDRDIELTAWASKITRDDYDIPFVKKFVHMLSQLDKEDWKAIEKMALMLAEEKDQA